MSKTRRGKATVGFKPVSCSFLCLILALLILIFYGNSLRAGLLSDSNPIIRQDPRLRALTVTNIERIFTEDYWWPTRATDLYRPVTTASYLVNYTILGSGENPAGYHAINLLLHWANVCLVLIILRRLTGRGDVAMLAACIFAVHPVNTEAITNVVGRADLMATLSVLFGGWCYLRAMKPGPQKKYWLILMGATACLGVLAKENAVMIVAFIGIYDLLYWWPSTVAKGDHRRLKTIWSEFAQGYAALIPSLALISMVRIWMRGKTLLYEQVFVDNPLVGATPTQRVLTATGVMGRYLKLLIFPRTLSADYSFNQIRLYGTGDSAGDAAALISLFVIALLLAAAFWFRRREPILSWGVLFFFLMILPTSNLLMVIGSIMAERFLYLPSIGFCAVAALALCKLRDGVISSAGPKWQVAAIQWGVPALLLGMLGVRTFVRNVDWRDEFSLWKSGVAAAPKSFRTHMGYGNAIWNNAQGTLVVPREQALDEAIAENEIAESILQPQPPIPAKWQDNTVYLSLADLYVTKADFLNDNGHRDDAMNFYRKSIDVLLKARELDRIINEASREFRLRQGVPREEIFDVGNFAIYKSLAFTYCRLQQWADCESTARYLEHLAPDEPSGYLLVGTAAYALHRETEALVQFLAGVLLDQTNEVLWRSLQAAYTSLGLSPNPVIGSGSGHSLNPEIPIVRQQLNEAAAMLVQRFEDAKRFEPARQAREQFIKQYAVPREAFSRNGKAVQ